MVVRRGECGQQLQQGQVASGASQKRRVVVALQSNETRIMSACHVALAQHESNIASPSPICTTIVIASDRWANKIKNSPILWNEPLDNITVMPTLQDLRQISPSDLADLVKSPEQKIRCDEDVAHWRHTTGYRDYQLFLRRLNESVVGYTVPNASDSDAADGGYSKVGADALPPPDLQCTCLLGHRRPSHPSRHTRQVDRPVTAPQTRNT